MRLPGLVASPATAPGTLECCTSKNWSLFGAAGVALLLACSFVPSQAQENETDRPIPAPPADVQLPEVETVISEEEFGSAIPDLDPIDDDDLPSELESIAEFERRFAADAPPAGDQPVQEAPLGLPQLADGDVVEEIADAPVTDTQLAAPLPAIDDFRFEPVEFAEPENDADVELAYSYSITGMEEAEQASSGNMRSMFRSLSALESGDGKAANIAQIRARLEEDVLLAQRVLASQGWYDAQITTSIARPQDEGGSLEAVIEISPGPRYVFADIVIDARETQPAELIRDNLPLQIGNPIIAERVQGAEANVSLALPQSGYPFAEIGQRDILLDRETGDGIYTLPVETGPRSVFGGIEVSGDIAFDAEHVQTLARFERGQLYDSRMVQDLREALVATGLFSTVSVSPQQSGEQTGEGSEFATLLVDQNAGPPRTIAGSAGYGTGEGFRIEGSWTHRNIFPPEGALIARGVLGTQEQGAGLSFRRSNAGRRDRTFELSAEALHSDYDAYEAFTGRLAGLVSYSSTPIWQKRLTYAYGAQLLASNEQDFDLALNMRDRRTFLIGGLTGQLGLDTTNDLLDPKEGFRLTALVEPEGSLQDGFTPYVRARLDGSAYLGFNENLVLAGRVRLGTIQGIDRFDLAPSRRFYAGGGGSVRGFGYQELGPTVLEPNPKYPDASEIEPGTDPADLPAEFLVRPIGGRSLFEAAAEARYRFGNFGLVGFVDAGQVYEETMPQFDDVRFGVGVGGRYYTNFGPLRLDVAMPLDRRPGEGRFAVYISIGQAF